MLPRLRPRVLNPTHVSYSCVKTFPHTGRLLCVMEETDRKAEFSSSGDPHGDLHPLCRDALTAGAAAVVVARRRRR